jgi:hypothetical protein
MTLVDPKFISLTTIQVGKRIKDQKKREFLNLRDVGSETSVNDSVQTNKNNK